MSSAIDLLPDEPPANFSAQEYYALGLRYRLAGLVERARQSLSKTIELAPSTVWATKASRVLRTQLPKLPVPARAEERNIEAYNLMHSEPAKAKEIFEELMQQFPDFEWPFSNMAWMLVREGNVKKARSLAKYLLTVNPDHLRSIHLSMQIALMERDLDEALRFANRARELTPEDEEFARMALMIKCEMEGLPADDLPTDLDAEGYYQLAETLAMLGRFRQARQAFNKVIDLDPATPAAARAKRVIKTRLPKQPLSEEAEERLEEAVKLKQTDVQAGKEALEKMLGDAPECEVAAMVIALTYIGEGDLEKAEEYTRLALQKNPDRTDAKLILFQLHLSNKQFSDALRLVEQLVASDADDLSFDLLRAQCELAMYQDQ